MGSFVTTAERNERIHLLQFDTNVRFKQTIDATTAASFAEMARGKSAQIRSS